MAFSQTSQRVTAYWQRFTSGSVNRDIFGSIMIVSGLTVGVKLISLIKELLVARMFGTGDLIEAFLIAYILPSYMLNVFGNPFAGALVPSFVKAQERESHEQAQSLLSAVVLAAVLVTGVLALVCGLAGPYVLPLLGSGFNDDKQRLTYSLLLTLLPLVLVSGLIDIAVAAANTLKCFAFTTLSAVVIPLTTVAVVLLFHQQWGSYALAGGTMIGFVLQLGLVSWRLQRAGFSLWPQWNGMSTPMKRVLAQYWPVVLGAALHNSAVIIDQSMAAMLGSGSVASLSYGNKLVALVQSVGATALGTAILPYFSRMVAVNNWTGVRHSLNTYTRLILLVTVPLALGAAAISRPLIELIYQGGAFTAEDTLTVSHVQALFVLQLPFFTLCILFVQLIVSLGATRLLMWGTIMNIALNTVFNYVLMNIMGVSGIALSTTLMYIASSIYLFIVLQRTLARIMRNDHANHSAHSVDGAGRR